MSEPVKFSRFMAAVAFGEMDVIKNMIAHDPDLVNQEDEQKISPLIQAIHHEQPEAFDYLIQSGADIDHRDQNGNTPLIWSALCGPIQVVKSLIDAGADPKIANNAGEYPLGAAVISESDRDIMDALYKHTISYEKPADSPQNSKSKSQPKPS